MSSTFRHSDWENQGLCPSILKPGDSILNSVDLKFISSSLPWNSNVKLKRNHCPWSYVTLEINASLIVVTQSMGCSEPSVGKSNLVGVAVLTVVILKSWP